MAPKLTYKLLTRSLKESHQTQASHHSPYSSALNNFFLALNQYLTLNPLRHNYFHSIFRILLLAVASAVSTAVADEPEQIEPVRILSFNTYNFLAKNQTQIKSQESKAAVIETLVSIAPDIMLLIEVGGLKAAQEIQFLLQQKGCKYPSLSVVDGEDNERKIVVLSKLDPVEVAHDTTAYYNLGGRHIRIQRGFAHCIFSWKNGYRLHLLGAHLKSKCFHPLGQTDMRRYEARQLRYLINTIIKKEPEANILVVGDFNDTPDSSPFKTVRGRRYKDTSEFYDLRPLDKHDMSWTYVWEKADTYSRIDYALASYHLLAEIDLDKTRIPFFADWSLASDHRPLLITLVPKDKPVDENIFSMFKENIRIAPTPMSSFHDGRVVGSRKVRR